MYCNDDKRPEKNHDRKQFSMQFLQKIEKGSFSSKEQSYRGTIVTRWKEDKGEYFLIQNRFSQTLISSFIWNTQ